MKINSMELYQLRSFVTVANEGRLTRAAQRLYTSQPAISAHIKSLEEELGVTLFVRTPRGMTLTKEGEQLKAQAETCLNAVNELFHQAKRLQGDVSGIARIGLNTSPEILKVSEFFSVMAATYPKLECHLLQSNSLRIPEKLRAGTLDAGYVYSEQQGLPELEIIVLQTRRVVIAGPANWKEKITLADWADIVDFPWICGDEECPFYRIIYRKFRERHLQPSKVVVVDEDATLYSLVRSGIGLSLMIEDEAVAAEQEGTITVWKKDSFTLDLYAVYLQERRSDPVIQAILNGINRVWKRLEQINIVQ